MKSIKNLLFAVACAILAAPLLSMERPNPREQHAAKQIFATHPNLSEGATPRQVLGLPESATVDQAKRAYRVLSLVYNPAKFKLNKAVWAKLGVTTQEEAGLAFAKINDAWNKLNQ